MKQRKGESMRIISKFGIGMAEGYCFMLQYMLVPSILPSISMFDLTALIIILAKEMITYDCHRQRSQKKLLLISRKLTES